MLAVPLPSSFSAQSFAFSEPEGPAPELPAAGVAEAACAVERMPSPAGAAALLARETEGLLAAELSVEPGMSPDCDLGSCEDAAPVEGPLLRMVLCRGVVLSEWISDAEPVRSAVGREAAVAVAVAGVGMAAGRDGGG